MKGQPKLQALLETILGTKNVYFQPPEDIRINYPAIVYQIDALRTEFASNHPYILHDRYQVTYIDRNPLSDKPKMIQRLPMTRFTSYFARDGLNHYNHSMYF